MAKVPPGADQQVNASASEQGRTEGGRFEEADRVGEHEPRSDRVGVAAIWGAVPPTRRRLRAWASAEPDLAGLDWNRLTGLLSDRAVPWDRKDDVLAALIRLSRSDPDATVAIAVCLSPGLWANARSLIRLHGQDDGWGEILAGLCERIARYDLDRRPRRIAANLIWDARHDLRRAVLAQARHTSHTRPEADPEHHHHLSSPAPELSAETILDLAEKAGMIAPVDSALIMATRINGLSLKEAASLIGIDYEAAKKRRQRADANLAHWWNAPEDGCGCVPPPRPGPAQIISLPLRRRSPEDGAAEFG